MLNYIPNTFSFFKALSLITLLCCGPLMAMDNKDEPKDTLHSHIQAKKSSDGQAKGKPSTKKKGKTFEQLCALSNEKCINLLEQRLNRKYNRTKAYQVERGNLIKVLKEKEMCHKVKRVPNMEGAMYYIRVSLDSENTKLFKKCWTYVFESHKNVFVQSTENTHTLPQLCTALQDAATNIKPPLKMPTSKKSCCCSSCCEEGGCCFSECCAEGGACYPSCYKKKGCCEGGFCATVKRLLGCGSRRNNRKVAPADENV